MKKKKLIAWICLIVWLIIIYAFSNQANSGKTTFDILGSIFNNASFETLKTINYIIRKLAHITEYFILCLIIINILEKYLNKYSQVIIISGLITFMLCLFDEYHQSFVPGRSALFTDCLIDLIGITLALIITFIKFKKK